MVDAHDIGPAARDDVADQTQLAGLVLERDHQVRLAAAHDQTARDDTGEDVYINVAARDQADGLFARQRQLAEKRGCHRCGTGPLGHQLLVFHQGQDGGGDLVLAYGDDVVHILADHLKGRFAGRLDCNAVCKGHGAVQCLVLVVVEGMLHAGGTGSLHAVDLYLGAQALDGKRYAGDQAAAADRHDDRVHIGQLVEDLKANGPLPCNNKLVIVGVDEGHAGLLLQLHSAVVGIVVGALDQLDLCAEALGALYLHNRGAVRHTDHAFNTHAGGGQRHALCVVAGRAGDDALGTLLPAELADLVVSAAHLEAARDLQVLGL